MDLFATPLRCTPYVTLALACIGCASAPATRPNTCPAPGIADVGAVSGGRVLITVENQMSNSFAIRRIVLGLDGTAICWRDVDPDKPFIEVSTLPALSIPLAQGPHKLQAYLYLRGYESSQGEYRFEIRGGHDFEVGRAKTMRITTVAYERPGDRPLLEERPAVRFVAHEDATQVSAESR